MDLIGWVRNRKDGSVEAVITGYEDEIERFIQECHRGPILAKVNEIAVNEGVDEELRSFEIREDF